MDLPNTDFTLAGALEEVKAKGRIVVHGAHRPILVVWDRGRVFALDNRCPHLGFPLDRGSVEDENGRRRPCSAILTLYKVLRFWKGGNRRRSCGLPGGRYKD